MSRSTERFRERTRILREVQLSERKWHLFWALLLCLQPVLSLLGYLVGLLSRIPVLERKRERERRIFALCKNKETISRVDGLWFTCFLRFAVFRDLFDLCRCA